MIEIQLTRDQVAIIDDKYADLLGYRWCALIVEKNHTVYAGRSANINGKRMLVSLHRTIMERELGRPLLENERVDHINGNGLDNRTSNLRLATPSENAQNRRRQQNNKSGYKGVSRKKDQNRWVAQIKAGGKVHHLGYFATPEAAYEAYCRAAKTYFGEFARFD